MTAHGRTVVFAHPSPDLYGSDRQLVESVRAVVAAGNRVIVTIPGHGPLEDLLQDTGCETVIVPGPTLNRGILTPRGLPGYAFASVRAIARAAGALRRTQPDIVYVNTLTLPTWLAAARLCRIPVLCHVHEAEDDGPRLLRALLVSPLRLAQRVVVNSEAARRSVVDVSPGLSSRTHLVYNGVPGPDRSAPLPARERTSSDTGLHVVCVGRLSPRKGTDLALDAVGILRSEGVNVHLSLAGSCFMGYEWFEDRLRARADRADLAGAVRFIGYVDDVYALLQSADVAVVPSRREPFGNTAVEAQLAGVPVIAAATQGLTEIVTDDTGLVFRAGDARELADRIAAVAADPAAARDRSRRARARAEDIFSTTGYASRIRAQIDETLGGHPTDRLAGVP
ncbi:MAG: glycosyltransferase family 4 protein [Gordonia paraffinivorans]